MWRCRGGVSSRSAWGVQCDVLRALEGDGDLHGFALVPLILGERITEDQQAVHRLAGWDLDIAAKRIHAHGGKLRISLKDLVEVEDTGAQAAARVAIGEGHDGPAILNGDGGGIGVVQTN